LTAAQVPELLQACEHHPLVDLNLVDLLSADAAGIDAMRRLRAAGAKLVGTNGYIQIKLDSTLPELA